MEWNEKSIAKLRALWAEGLSTAEIGRRMGVSKNAVVGKAHRLNLPSRPSPIRRDVERTQRRRLPRRVQGPTLPALSASLAPMPQEAPRIVERAIPVLRAVCLPRPGAASRRAAGRSESRGARASGSVMRMRSRGSLIVRITLRWRTLRCGIAGRMRRRKKARGLCPLHPKLGP